MRRAIFMLLGCSCLVWSLTAQSKPVPHPSQILFQVAVEQWVKTTSARVVVAINATATQSELVKIRQEMKQNLQQLAKGEWHISSFNRNRDSAGLERIYAQAEARLPESVWGNLYARAEKISRPGAKYRVSQIQFRPNLVEVEAVRGQLRDKIYTRVNAELKTLKQQYPQQCYEVKDINFVFSPRQALAAGIRSAKMLGRAQAEFAVAALAVSKKLQLQATVSLGSYCTQQKD
jgi:hypothetical protein